jgi:hypothetical protein
VQGLPHPFGFTVAVIHQEEITFRPFATHQQTGRNRMAEGQVTSGELAPGAHIHHQQSAGIGLGCRSQFRAG